MMAFGRFLLLTALLVPVPGLAEPLMAGDTPVKPAKSAQDCADELLRSKEAIEASGESPQEFFHRCWWDSVPGRPTPIKTPRATWDPGHGRITKKTTPASDAKKAAEAKGVAPTRAAQTAATQQAKDGTPTVGPKTSSAPEKSAERVPATKPSKVTEKAGAPSPPAKPKSVAETQPGSVAGAKPKNEPKPGIGKTAPSKDTGAKETKPAHAPGAAAPAKGSTVVTAPDAVPASMKLAAPGAVVVKSSPKPKRVAVEHTRSKARSALLETPSASVRERDRYANVEPFLVRPPHHVRHVERYRRLETVAARFGHPRRAPFICLYALPDAAGRSPCVPLQ